ncbi:hypothetical protein [Streptomyces zaomyceticus]|uniref:hypothetical protein n=1 Tax=Streptomyces zaomyceticus TaxID=68286 RepID=UPI0037B8F4C6
MSSHASLRHLAGPHLDTGPRPVHRHPGPAAHPAEGRNDTLARSAFSRIETARWEQSVFCYTPTPQKGPSIGREADEQALL